MADLRLVSTRKRQIKPLVEGALANELLYWKQAFTERNKGSRNLRKNITLELKGLFPVMKTTSWKKPWILMNGLVSLGCWHDCGKRPTHYPYPQGRS